MESVGSMPYSQRLSNNPYSEPNQPNSSYWYHLFKIHTNIVRPSTPRHSKRSFPVGLRVKILKTLIPSSILATWPAHLNLIDLIILNIFRYNLWSCSLWSILHSIFASVFGPNIRLRILFSNTLRLCSSLNVWGHASQPWQYYCFIYFNFQIFREKSRRKKCLDCIISQHFISSWK